jgi:hypothetical protein
VQGGRLMGVVKAELVIDIRVLGCLVEEHLSAYIRVGELHTTISAAHDRWRSQGRCKMTD